MQLGMIGLGRMGANMVRRLRQRGIEVVGLDRDAATTGALAEASGMGPATSLAELLAMLDPPRAVWLMLPAGDITEGRIAELRDALEPGDTVVDGGNAFYKDSMRRAEWLGERDIHFIDAGVSGGVWGLEQGYALTLGGQAEPVARLRPVLEALAPAADQGWLHCGPSGSGHYVKMIHNGIEYGMMQAYAEGFALLEARADFDLDLAAIAETWRHGSVVRSWLLDLTARVLGGDAGLEGIAPFVADSGEGRWTALEAVEQGVPAPVMSTALMMRFASQGGHDFAARLLAAMRQQFGGHAVKRSTEE